MLLCKIVLQKRLRLYLLLVFSFSPRSFSSPVVQEIYYLCNINLNRYYYYYLVYFIFPSVAMKYFLVLFLSIWLLEVFSLFAPHSYSGIILAQRKVSQEDVWELSLLLPFEGVLPPSHLLKLRKSDRIISAFQEGESKPRNHNNINHNNKEDKHDVIIVSIVPLAYTWFRRALFRIGEVLGITARFPTPLAASSLSLCPIPLSVGEITKPYYTSISFSGYWEKIMQTNAFGSDTHPATLALFEDGCKHPILYFPFPVSETPYELNMKELPLQVDQQAEFTVSDPSYSQDERAGGKVCKAFPFKQVGATGVRLSKNSFVLIFAFDDPSSKEVLPGRSTSNSSSLTTEDGHIRCYLPIQGVRLEEHLDDHYFRTVVFTIALIIIVCGSRSRYLRQVVQGKIERNSLAKQQYGILKNREATAPLSSERREELRRRRDELIAQMLEIDKQKKGKEDIEAKIFAVLNKKEE